MKAFVIAAALAAFVGSQIVAAVPRDAASAGDNHASGPMTWSGRLFPGDDEHTTIAGTVKSIYDQILARNPRFAGDTHGNPHGMVPHHAPSFRRDAVDEPDLDSGPGSLDCNAPSDPTHDNAANWYSCNITYHYLDVIGKYGGLCTIPANSCKEIVCFNGCQLTVCNHWDVPFSPDCKDLANDMRRLHEGCSKDLPPGGVALESRDNVIFFEGTIAWPHHNTSVSSCPPPQ
ncbi:hypothetical protein V8F20_011096 [Naviculisporaceae sp. PSN 640]